MTHLPTGKLSAQLLAEILKNAPSSDPRIILGPGIGLDCGVVQLDDMMLVFKSEPITFVTDQIGWYAVQVAVNDIATTGAQPRWMMLTVLLPEGKTTPELVHTIADQVHEAAKHYDISLIGGHTEITNGLDRPILCTSLIGEVKPDQLITPRGAQPGDRVLLTKSIPIEGTAILAREFPDLLRGILTREELEEAQNYIHSPGISVWRDARFALRAGRVNAMHDPTEGGLATALWELAEASGLSLEIWCDNIPITPLSLKVCNVFQLEPLGTIASGSLLLTVPLSDSPMIQSKLSEEGISCAEIGEVKEGKPEVWQRKYKERILMPRYDQDEITRAFRL